MVSKTNEVQKSGTTALGFLCKVDKFSIIKNICPGSFPLMVMALKELLLDSSALLYSSELVDVFSRPVASLIKNRNTQNAIKLATPKGLALVESSIIYLFTSETAH